RGYVCHNSLAFDPATRAVLGLANQILHHRDDVPKGESSQAKRERATRESLLWLRGCAVLSVWRYRTRRPELSVREFFLALARLGGHQNRRHDGTPGWLVLW